MATRVVIDVPPRPGERLLVDLCGELDVGDADGVRGVLVDAVQAGPVVVVDLSALSFIDLAGLRALHGAHGGPGMWLLPAARRPSAVPHEVGRGLVILAELDFRGGHRTRRAG